MQRARLTARYSGSVGTVALSADDLPLGLQVMGFAGEDARLFAIAAALRDLLERHHTERDGSEKIR
jgi:Asp-tRNA(Asn)/Glu-tRNA(Gln) amidotransferase A subunit family amidase